MPGCKSECTLSQVDRAFIYSTLQVCRWLAVIAITVSASVCLPLSYSLSHLSAWDVSMRNKQPRLWPFDRQTVGNKTSENRRRRRRKRNKSEWCPRRVNLVLPHWESCSVELNNHVRLYSGGRSVTAERILLQREKPESQVLCGIKITKIWQRSNHYVVHVFWPSLSFTNHATLVSHCVVIDWGRQLVIHEHLCRSIWFSPSAFDGRLFYSLIKWDSTLPPCSHLSVSLHDNQLMHVQTRSGNAPYNNPDKGYRGNSAKHWSAAVSLPSPCSWNVKG